MRYTNLALLIRAYETGKINSKNHLKIDHNSCSVYEMYDEEGNELPKDVFQYIYEETPDVLLKELLDYVGIPWDEAYTNDPNENVN